MAEKERRYAARQQESFPVSLGTVDAQELDGRSVNWSATGVLLQVHGQIDVVLQIKGKQYRGRLVRGLPVDDDTTAWAVELDTAVDSIADHPSTAGGPNVEIGEPR